MTKKRRECFLILTLLVPVMEPKLFTQFSFLVYLFSFLNIAVFAYLFTMLLLSEKKISILFYLWITYRAYMLVVSLFNGKFEGLMQWGYLTLMISNCILVFERFRYSYCEIIKAIYFISNLLLLCNLITIFLFPRGIIESSFYDVTAGDYYVLGIKTQFTTMMFPAIATALFLSVERNARNYIVVSAILCLANIFCKLISTAIVGFVLLLVLIFINYWKNIKYTGVFIILAWFICQVLFVFIKIQNFFADFFVEAFHKDASFSSRVYIWNVATSLLENSDVLHLMFGHGLYKNDFFVPFSGSMWQPHNQFLSIIYSNGVIGLFLFCVIIWLCLRGAFRRRSYEMMVTVCFLSLLLSLTEVYFNVASCWIPFICTYYYRQYRLLKVVR